MAYAQTHVDRNMAQSKRPDTSKDPVTRLRDTILSRGESGIKQFSRTFRIYDQDGNKKLNRDEFQTGLKKYVPSFTQREMDKLFMDFDIDQSGSIDMEELLRAIRPPMSASRKALIDQAFKKMDKSGDGVITIDDLKGVYNCRQHPKFQSGEWTEARVFAEYLNSFEPRNGNEKGDGKVTKEEFVDYYRGVSVNIDQDTYFDLMMRQCWKL